MIHRILPFVTRLAVYSTVACAGVACGGTPCPVTRMGEPTAPEAHAASRSVIRTLRAEARVEQWGKKGRVRGTVLLMLERPARVRFDTLTQLGPVSILTSDKGRFALTDLRDNRFVQGTACPANVSMLVGFPMGVQDLLRFLVGDAPSADLTGKGPEVQSLQAAPCKGGVQVFRLKASHEQRTLHFGRVSDQPVLFLAESRRADGELLWRVRYDRHRPVKDPVTGRSVMIPFRAKFKNPSQKANTTVRFQSVEINVPLPRAAFLQDPSPGLAQTILLCPHEAPPHEVPPTP